jgi:hypothetical protein
MTTADPRRSRIEQFLRRDLADWVGLPEGCSEENLERWLSLRPGEGIVQLGTEIVTYRFRVVEAAGFAEPVRLHFREGELRLIRTGLWSKDRRECEQMLRDLGDPPGRADLMFGMGMIADGEWVYAARGLTVGVIPETGLIASVSAYQPCSADVYLQRFHDRRPTREFPR